MNSVKPSDLTSGKTLPPPTCLAATESYSVPFSRAGVDPRLVWHARHGHSILPGLVPKRGKESGPGLRRFETMSRQRVRKEPTCYGGQGLVGDPERERSA